MCKGKGLILILTFTNGVADPSDIKHLQWEDLPAVNVYGIFYSEPHKLLELLSSLLMHADAAKFGLGKFNLSFPSKQ